MSTDEKVKVDVIVVGGGPAGLAAAYVTAKAGLEVVLVERGAHAGAKNVGGLLYGTTLNKIMPKFYEKAPIERPVSKRSLNYLGAREHFSVQFGSDEWSAEPFNNTFIVHRTQFDKWFATQVEEAGASLLEGTVVDDLIYDTSPAGKKVVGIKMRGDEEFYADVVILAEGANALLTEKACASLGLKTGKRTQEYAVGVKEIIGLPKEKIEDRFGLAPNEGAALDFFGVPFEGSVGGGFIYTGKEAIHVGFAARADSLVHSQSNPSDMLDRFKNHPRVQPLIAGGELLEYSAHLIPEGGFHAIGELCGNGVMIAGDAAGFVNMSLYKEGTNHAMESGKLAGETAVMAKQLGDFSAATLRAYERALKGSTVFKDLKKYRNVPKVMEHTPNLFSLYPKKVAQLMVDYFTVRDETKSRIQRKALFNFLKGLPKLTFVRDALRARNLC